MRSASGLEIKLLVAGVAIEELQGEAEEANPPNGTALTRYVEAVAGSTFGVRFAAPPGISPSPTDSICCRVYLDGKYATGRVFDAGRFACNTFTFVIEGIDQMTSRGRELQRFMFAQLKTNDSPVTAKDKPEKFKDLGLVNVECTWCRKTGDNQITIQDTFKPAINTTIPEKCLKGQAISNQASVAKAQPIPGTFNTVDLTYPYGAKPFACFRFKYRSRKDLQIESIIEKDPEPVALEDRDPATLTAEEVGQLQRRLQEKREETAKIKKEKRAWAFQDDGDKDQDADGVVVLGGAPKKRKSPDSGVEMIDLTDD